MLKEKAAKAAKAAELKATEAAAATLQREKEQAAKKGKKRAAAAQAAKEKEAAASAAETAALDEGVRRADAERCLRRAIRAMQHRRSVRGPRETAERKAAKKGTAEPEATEESDTCGAINNITEQPTKDDDDDYGPGDLFDCEEEIDPDPPPRTLHTEESAAAEKAACSAADEDEELRGEFMHAPECECADCGGTEEKKDGDESETLAQTAETGMSVRRSPRFRS